MAETAMEYGPYYRTSRRAQEAQRKALGLPVMNPAAIAAERYGELSAYLGEARGRRKELSDIEAQKAQTELTEAQTEAIPARLAMERRAERRAERKETTQEVSSAVSGVATVALVGSEIGLWSWIATTVVSILGCCWTFLEGEMLTNNVRRYRDEHYDKLTSSVSFGYRWMSTWLVPLMKCFKLVKFIVKWIMLRPLASYADWYYGENSYGWMFYPLKAFWTNVWRLVGLIIEPSIVFLKKEVV